jgi:hypothetical protein
VRQAEPQRQIFQQAAGLVIEPTTEKVWTAIVQHSGEGFRRTHQAVFDLAEDLDNILRRLNQLAGGLPTPVIIGLDTSRLRFLEMTLPLMETSGLALLIRTQAEAQLPLEGHQMQLAWRLSPGRKTHNCTVAALRRDSLDAALDKLFHEGRISAIIPAAAGFVRLGQHLFSALPDDCVIMCRRNSGFAVMLLEKALLGRCIMLAEEDLADCPAMVIQDLLMELETIEKRTGRKVPIYLWPEKDASVSQIQSQLNRLGWQTSLLQVNPEASQYAQIDVSEDCYDPHFEAAGLALIGLSEPSPAFDFLQSSRMAQPLREARMRQKQSLRSVAVMAIILLLCIGAGYWTLKLHVRQLGHELSTEVKGLKAETLLQQQNYQETVARARLDLIDLIEAIQTSREGLVLDSIEFEKGKPIKLSAAAGDYGQVYGFQKRFQAQKGVSALRLIDPRVDERSKQVRFTMQFHYKHFTK